MSPLVARTYGTLLRTMGRADLIDLLNAEPPSVARGVYDVRRYGAAGDGIEDDTQAIQYTIGVAAAAGGGTVYLPGGTYTLSRQGVSASAAGGYALRMATGVSLRGAGYGTVIRNTGMLGGLSDTDNATWYSGFECLDGTHDLVIEDLRFLGDNSPFQNSTVWYQRQMDCIGMRGTTCHDITVRHVWFQSQYGFSVHNEGTGQRIHVVDCPHRQCANGLNVNADQSIQARNTLEDAESIETSGAYSVLAENIIVRPTQAGIGTGGFTSPGRIPGVVILGCIVVDGLDAGIVATDAIDGAVIANCSVIRTVRSGIMLATGGWNPVQRVQVRGCNLIDCGKLTNTNLGDRCGIYAQANVDGLIEGNTVDYGVTAGYDTAYAINVGPSASGLRIRGNKLRGSFKDITINSPNVQVTADNVVDWAKVELAGAGTYLSQPSREGWAAVTFPGSGNNVVVDPRAGTYLRLAVTDATAFTVYTTNVVGGIGTGQTQRIVLTVYNATAGALPAIAFNNAAFGGFRVSGSLTAPAAGKSRSITFHWDPAVTQWIEDVRGAADV